MIVSRVDTAADLRKPPIQVEAVGTALRGRPSWDQFDDLTTMAYRDAGAQLWDAHRPEADRRAARRDVRRLLVHHDDLARGDGLLRQGRVAARSSRAAQRIARDGVLPLNTHGGQLSAGRLHGYGFLHEACVQLWGEAGERQVPGDPEVGVARRRRRPAGRRLLLTRRR